jgi:hypothetical protein
MSGEIERLRALLAEATPGPWLTGIGRFSANALAAERPGLLLAEVHTALDGDWIFAERHQEAALIAAAVNALPALLNVVDAAQAATRYRLPVALQDALDRLDGAS